MAYVPWDIATPSTMPSAKTLACTWESSECHGPRLSVTA